MYVTFQILKIDAPAGQLWTVLDTIDICVRYWEVWLAIDNSKVKCICSLLEQLIHSLATDGDVVLDLNTKPEQTEQALTVWATDIIQFMKTLTSTM